MARPPRLLHAILVSLCIDLYLLASPAAAVSWLESQEHEGIAYFLVGSGAIERYDLASEVWLDPLLLSDNPTAFAVDDAGIFVAFGRRVSRLTPDGTTETPLENTSDDIGAVATDGNLLLLVSGSTLRIVDKNTGTSLGSGSSFYRARGISSAPETNRLFGRSTGVSPSDIVYFEYADDGSFVTGRDSPHHGDFPGGTQTWVFPEGARVIDDAGIIYQTNDLAFAGSLGGALDDLDFFEDLPIVLRGQTLYAYSNALLEAGRLELAFPADEIFVFGENVFVFHDSPVEGIGVSVVALADIGPLEPGSPIDPTGLSYEPDAIVPGADGILYLLSAQHLSVFRWSVAERRYLETLPLTEAPLFLAYSAENAALYLAYPSGRITAIDAADPAGELAFANATGRPCGLATAGEYVFTCDPSGAWVSHFTYAPDGTLLSQVEWNYRSNEYVWSAVNRKMYFFRDDTSPNDILWEDIGSDGLIGTKMDSPFHSSSGIRHPVRVAPDGSVVVLGSGRIHDALTLDLVDELANDVTDSTWMDGLLFTVRALDGLTQIQEWNPAENYAPGEPFRALGEPMRVLPLDGELLIVTRFEGAPLFSIKEPGDTDLDEDAVDDADDNCPRISNSDQSDVNGDGIGDLCQPSDGDGDGWPDLRDNCPQDPNPDQLDTDGDGFGDVCEPPDADADGVPDANDNCVDTPNQDQADADFDAVGDACEPDSDDDGVIDDDDNCRTVPNPDQLDTDGDGVGDACTPPDHDFDGVLNASDNCPRAYNPGQADTDADGVGDACEPDSDRDGVVDDVDNCPSVFNPSQTDSNEDGYGDACQPRDTDFDGLLDPEDNCPFRYNPAQDDADDDGVGDACEGDADGDGVVDDVDNCPFTWNPSQSDLGEDGVGDACTPGDLDADGDVDRLDVNATLEILGARVLFGHPADMDSDGWITLTDVQAMVAACTWEHCEDRASACGLGFELVFLLPALRCWRRRRRNAPH